MVVIYGINKHLNPIKRELSEAIHACMQSVLGMPEKKRAMWYREPWCACLFLISLAL
jgi:hypothetical protein